MNDRSMLEPGNVAEVRQSVREARAAGRRLRVGGAGQVERFGSHATSAAQRVSLRRLDGIEIAARDFTARVGAGARPADLDRALHPLGLVWPLRRLETPGTIGGLIASGLASPISAQDAPARRWVLGARLVDGEGEALTVGGATVKNSVGYGVTHALWGSQGRLGAIVEVTLRLRRRRAGDDDPGPTLDRAALQAAAALVRCDDLAPGTAALALDGLQGATQAAASSDGLRAVGCYAGRQAAEADAAALRARGIEAHVAPDSDAEAAAAMTQMARAALDPDGVFV